MADEDETEGSDETKGSTLEIGGKSRTIFWAFGAFRAARRKFPNKTVKQLLEELDPGTMPDFAACGFLHDDRTVSGDMLLKWLDKDPQAYALLQLLTIQEVMAGYKRMTPKGERKGEIEAVGAALVAKTLAAVKEAEAEE